MSDILFTVAVPTFNRLELLKICLAEICKQVINLSEGEVLVIDDRSTDNTKELLIEYAQKYSFFRYVISETNQGISKNRNKLVNHAKGKYIIFVDSDVFISEGLIEKHLEILQKNENSICQSHLILVDQIDKKSKLNLLTDYSRAFFDTANVSIERKKIIEVGYFDEKFSGYGWEDLELGLRLKNLGVKCIKKNDIYSYHYQARPDLKKIDTYIKKEKDRAKGSVYFNQKHNSFNVKMMTQIYKFSQVPTILCIKMFKIEKTFIKTIEKFPKKDYNRFIFLFRTYMNYIYIRELNNLLKQK